MIETGKVVGFDAQGLPRVKLDRDNSPVPVVVRMPRPKTLTSTSVAGPTVHAHLVTVGVVGVGDVVVVIDGKRGDWFLLYVY